jgi:thioredoxin-like negative regulator of GroEL
MAKKHKKEKKKTKNNHGEQKKRAINWKNVIQKSTFYLVLCALIIGTFLIYSNNTKAEYDLSVIGNGTPTVVQIHDHNCRLCRQLKSNLDDVKKDFSDKVQFKTANILAKKGAEFAQKHQVAHVTLLFFNKKGQRANVLQGVSSKDEIRSALEQLIKQR